MVFTGYFGFLHYLQLASHELTTKWHKCDIKEKQNSKCTYQGHNNRQLRHSYRWRTLMMTFASQYVGSHPMKTRYLHNVNLRAIPSLSPVHHTDSRLPCHRWSQIACRALEHRSISRCCHRLCPILHLQRLLPCRSLFHLQQCDRMTLGKHEKRIQLFNSLTTGAICWLGPLTSGALQQLLQKRHRHAFT